MVQAFGGLAWLSLLASASALCYPAVRGHLSCVARVNPAMARLPWKPKALVDVDGKVPDGWYADIVGWGVPPPWPWPWPWRQELDELIATLSYDGWQDDVAGMKDARNPWQEMRGMRQKQQVHDRRLTQPGRPAPLGEVEDEIK